MISERGIERILQEEQDEAIVEKAISEFTGVPGGRYWEPGWEGADPEEDIPVEYEFEIIEELPFN